MPLLGSDVSDPNFLLRFCGIVFIGVIGCGIALLWRSELFFVSEYQEIPFSHYQIKIKNANEKKQKNFKNIMIQTEE